MFQPPGSTQRQPDGTGPSAEKPINITGQGRNNVNPGPHQSLSPLVPNDLFMMDTAPEHQSNRSTPGLFGDEGNGIYSFGGGHTSQQIGTNQMHHPHKSGSRDGMPKVNVLYITEVVQRAWENETVLELTFCFTL